MHTQESSFPEGYSIIERQNSTGTIEYLGKREAK
jgi:hypothetical protein